MSLSQKCQYSLRAIYELAKRRGRGPVKIADIAEVQVIPHKFLEIILGQLKQGGFVESIRGRKGGYRLAADPDRLTAGDIIRYCDGPISPVECLRDPNTCKLKGDCAFIGMWRQAQTALSDVYDGTTFADLVQREGKQETTIDYSI